MGSKQNYIKSDLTAAAILDTLHQNSAMSVTEIANEIDRSKGTIYKHLDTLQKADLVVKDDKIYRISLKFLTYGGKERSRWQICNISEEYVHQIANETGLVCVLGVLERNKIIATNVKLGEYSMLSGFPLGLEAYPHTNSTGKVILAELPRDKAQKILEKNGMPKVAEKTITDIEDILSKLPEIEEQGYAVTDSERKDGWSTIAVPVGQFQENKIGGLTIAGPSSRFDRIGINKYNELLKSSANEINIMLQDREGNN